MAHLSTNKTRKVLREVAFLGFITTGLLFFISLITFSNEDAGWTHSGSVQQIANACGVVGAWVADFLLSIFGVMAYLFPLMFGRLAWQLYAKNDQERGKFILSVRWVGFVATMVSGCAILYLHILRLQVELPRNTGGILGQEIGNVLAGVLGSSGSSLLFFAIFLGGITLFTGLSWFAVLDTTGRWTIFAVGFVWQKLCNMAGVVSSTFALWQANQTEKPDISLFPDQAPIATTPAPTPEPPTPIGKISTEEHDLFAPEQKTQDLPNQGCLPSSDLLDLRPVITSGYSAKKLQTMARQVEAVLKDFSITAKVVEVAPGPVITRFELQLAAGVKVSKISGLAKDIARGLSVISVRIVDVIQGKSVIGIEIPNEEREMVSFRDLIDSDNFQNAASQLTFAMGKSISGTPVVADLAKMPHVLVAGTTGSGKSVAINTMILSMLYKATPQDVRLIMIDPKMLELSVYEGIPHLLTPVVTDMKDAQNALRWAVAEMERRYKLMSKLGVRNLNGYNQKITESDQPIADPLFQLTQELLEDRAMPTLDTLPSIVIVIDELADMMMIVGKKVEVLIARLAQKARAAGIHLVLATQRPSVDVLTGLIKANVPARLSFQVSSRIDSRTILDQSGAEALLGNGDMLFLPPGTSIPIRAHGAFVDDHEVHSVVGFLKATGSCNYVQSITQERNDSGEAAAATADSDTEVDSLYDEALFFVTKSRKASISGLQRQFKMGYNRAARLIEGLEAAGVVSEAQHNGTREVLAAPPPD